MKKSTKILAIILVCILCVGIGAGAALVIFYEIRDELDLDNRGSALRENEKINPESSTGSPSVTEVIEQAIPENGDTATEAFIGEDSAKEIALSDAGVNEADIRFEKVKLERDDGIWQYEIEFSYGRTEYDYDIKAADGTILSRDVDYDD